MKFSCLALLAAVLLSGCETIRYEYTAPGTESGRQCTLQCASLKETCKVNENRRAENAQRTCMRDSDMRYSACVRVSRTRDDIKDCDRSKKSCYLNTNYGSCESEYQHCYTNCGGQVKRIVEKPN